MTIEVRLLEPEDAVLLGNVEDGVFDHPVDGRLTREFLDDPRHHLSVALADGLIVGFASAVHYVHPDKPPELWINEVGVAPAYQRRGVGKAVVGHLLAHARAIGCAEAWVLTEHGNVAARALYRSVGGNEGDAGVMVSFKLSAVRPE